MSQELVKAREQGVHCEVESEGFEEKYQAVINESDSDDEPVGQRWGKAEPVLLVNGGNKPIIMSSHKLI